MQIVVEIENVPQKFSEDSFLDGKKCGFLMVT